MSPTDLLEYQEVVQEQIKKPDLTTADGIHEFFGDAMNFDEECMRYAQIISANGGLRPAVLDERPIYCQRYYSGWPMFGPASGE